MTGIPKGPWKVRKSEDLMEEAEFYLLDPKTDMQIVGIYPPWGGTDAARRDGLQARVRLFRAIPRMLELIEILIRDPGCICPGEIVLGERENHADYCNAAEDLAALLKEIRG